MAFSLFFINNTCSFPWETCNEASMISWEWEPTLSQPTLITARKDLVRKCRWCFDWFIPSLASSPCEFCHGNWLLAGVMLRLKLSIKQNWLKRSARGLLPSQLSSWRGLELIIPKWLPQLFCFLHLNRPCVGFQVRAYTRQARRLIKKTLFFRQGLSKQVDLSSLDARSNRALLGSWRTQRVKTLRRRTALFCEFC